MNDNKETEMNGTSPACDAPQRPYSNYADVLQRLDAHEALLYEFCAQVNSNVATLIGDINTEAQPPLGVASGDGALDRIERRLEDMDKCVQVAMRNLGKV